MSVALETWGEQLAASGSRAYAALEAAGRLRAGATLPRLELPPAFERHLTEYVTLERTDPGPQGSQEETILTHYLETLPTLLVEQVCAEAPWSARRRTIGARGVAPQLARR